MRLSTMQRTLGMKTSSANPFIRPRMVIAPPSPAMAAVVSPQALPLVSLVASAQQSQAQAVALANGQSPASVPSMSRVDFADIEHRLKLDPVATLGRCFRVYLIGGVSANGVLTFTPQRDCMPFRLLTPDAATGSFTNLLAGVEPYFDSADPVPASLFNKLAYDTAYLKPYVLQVGQKVTATNTGTIGECGMFAFDLSENGMLSSPTGGLMKTGFTAAIAAGVTAVIKVHPELSKRFRRLIIDDIANAKAAAGSIVNSISVGVTPQFESGDGVPVECFSIEGQNLWMDGDLCPVGADISISITNTSAGTVTFMGAVEGDTED